VLPSRRSAPGTRRTRTRLAAVGIAIGLVAAGVASQAAATTGPSKQRYVYLIITDRKIAFHNDDLTSLTRGSYLRFFVFNEGKKQHQLAIKGRKTPRIPPGGRGQTPWILFNSRGTFHFFDPLDRSLSGSVTIL
jgi:hypothetical protein